jgi:hypothetical protein
MEMFVAVGTCDLLVFGPVIFKPFKMTVMAPAAFVYGKSLNIYIIYSPLCSFFRRDLAFCLGSLWRRCFIGRLYLGRFC